MFNVVNTSNSGCEEFFDVEVTLGMAAARRIGVRKLIDEHNGRFAFQDRVEVHFLEHMAVILDLGPWHDFEAVKQGLRLRAPMRLDHPHYDVGALKELGARGQKHLVGFTDARRRTQKHLEAATAFISFRASTRSASGDGRLMVSVSAIPLSLRVARPLQAS